jgi:hypothetical protein
MDNLLYKKIWLKKGNIADASKNEKQIVLLFDWPFEPVKISKWYQK